MSKGMSHKGRHYRAIKIKSKNPRRSCSAPLSGSDAPMSESEIVELLKKHGISVMLGERHSVRCQFGQLVNVVRDLEKQPNDMVSLVGKQDEYIGLLAKEGGECAVIASVHGWKTKRFAQGLKLRAEIERLKQEANVTNELTEKE